ncbi:MAG: hypothetical protein ALECFALPRED_009427 [Alectoria fallacina]|uniref:Uncharacterized protein n=1 Tax=Alectoria fallacina TaxID=1903189 RepID=A0A8H3PI83_9LECA|nr:MAG: hypothetical protein ALECFALPRED_009427 [Alectoria fallacina]
MRPDFDTCGQNFLNNSAGIYNKYQYNGSVQGILSSARPALITLQGCKELCGTGVDYYPWVDASATLTTWILPIAGLLVQAPYESNKAWQTILALSRWAGSPIATLSYILWNIKVTGKCALMIDMATKYEEYPEQGSEFSMMRDSLYILCIMNQYSAKQSLPPIEAERLLRLALFSNLLPLNGSSDGRDLVKRRTELAQNFREGRKKGVIPVFVSFLWFVFALALSIQLAYGNIGGNETAHNLALGFLVRPSPTMNHLSLHLVGWLPIFILASTVDRNLVSADSIRQRLNDLVNDVRLALLDPQVISDYMRITSSTEEDFAWTKCLNNEELFGGDFFEEFAGQGRTHWHYGVAHPILCGIETKFMADYGRDWLRHGHTARLAIVVGSRNVNGLKMFDPRMLWQITSSIFVVCGSVGGAFILSYFTPTVGLGCRSGGYMVFAVMATGLLVIELLVWWLTHQTTHTPEDLLAKVGSKLERHISRRQVFRIEKKTKWQGRQDAFLSWLTTTTFRDVMRNFVLRPGEVVNTVWLVYIIMAQTFGAYQTCDCMASVWAAHGGFIDFQTYAYYAAHGVYYYWGAATGLSVFVMSTGLAYIVTEYCTQSYMSTEDYGRAMKGLRSTRRFKKHTRFVRFVPHLLIKFGKFLAFKVVGGRSRRGRRSLVWTAETKMYRLGRLGYRMNP